MTINNELEAASLGGAEVKFEFQFDPVGYAAYIHEIAASSNIDPSESTWVYAGAESKGADECTAKVASSTAASADPYSATSAAGIAGGDGDGDGDGPATIDVVSTASPSSHGIVGWVLWYLSQGETPPTYLAIKTEAIEVWGMAEFEAHKDNIKATLVNWHPGSVKATEIGASHRTVVPIKQPLPTIPLNQLHSDSVFVIRIGTVGLNHLFSEPSVFLHTVFHFFHTCSHFLISSTLFSFSFHLFSFSPPASKN